MPYQRPANTILECAVGSRAYGTSTDSSDNDIRGVRVESLHEAFGLHSNFEQYEYRTATERTGNTNEPSQDGDFDVTIYGLRKFLRLALRGNPSVIELFFLKGVLDARGGQLQELAPLIVSQHAGNAYLGYLIAQKQRLLGERGQMRTTRTELIEKFGYDTKYAAQALRLGYQGIELLTTGRLVMPLEGEIRQELVDVRNGLIPFNDVLSHLGVVERRLKDLTDDRDCVIRKTPDVVAVDVWMQRIYIRLWSAERTTQDRVDERQLWTRESYDLYGREMLE